MSGSLQGTSYGAKFKGPGQEETYDAIQTLDAPSQFALSKYKPHSSIHNHISTLIVILTSLNSIIP